MRNAIKNWIGYEQPEPGDPGLYIYDDATGAIVASSLDEPSEEEKRRLSESLIVTDPREIELFRDSRRLIRWRDKVLLDRHGNENPPAPPESVTFTVTRYADGRLFVDWPDNVRGPQSES